LGHTFLVRDTSNRLIDVKTSTITYDIWDLDYYIDDETLQITSKQADAEWIGQREARNFLQSKMIRPVTKVGFEKIRVPDDLYRTIYDFFHQNQHASFVESKVGPCLNQEIADTHILELPSDLRAEIIRVFQDIIDKWANLGPLKYSSLYGIRTYTRKGILEMHTDTAHTHAVSAIVNVDQDVEKDWPLEIYDHDGNLHQVIMKPGDAVLYESARLIHGRTFPLIGNSYSNFFIHFMPIDISNWDYQWL